VQHRSRRRPLELARACREFHRHDAFPIHPPTPISHAVELGVKGGCDGRGCGSRRCEARYAARRGA
jgi:hypothetical protein